MPTWMKFAGLWSLAAIVALALSWVAVSQVRDRVIQPVTVIPTTIVAVDAALPDPTVVAVDPELEPALDPSLVTSTTVRLAGSTSTTNTTRPPSSSPASSSTAPPQTTTTTVPAQTTTTTTPSPTTTVQSSNLTTSSYSVTGGSVTISSAPGQVNFVSAIPQAGFTTELRDTGPERVRVRFVSTTLVSEFEAEWDDGELDIETSEHTP